MLEAPVAALAAEVPHSFSNAPAAFAAGREPTVAEGMAEIIVRLAKNGQPTSFGDFTNAGYKPSEIGAHYPKAKAIADAIVIRQDAIDAPEPTYSPHVRFGMARQSLDCRIRPFAEDILDDLRRRHFSDAEILEFWPQLMAELATRARGLELQVA